MEVIMKKDIRQRVFAIAAAASLSLTCMAVPVGATDVGGTLSITMADKAVKTDTISVSSAGELTASFSLDHTGGVPGVGLDVWLEDGDGKVVATSGQNGICTITTTTEGKKHFATTSTNVTSASLTWKVKAGSYTLHIENSLNAQLKGSVSYSLKADDLDDAKIISITLNKTAVTLTEKQQAAILTAAVNPTNADQSVKWSSSDTSVATVNTNGRVVAVANGTATITAASKTDSTKTATCTVTVAIKEKAVATAPTDAAPTYNGKAQELVTGGSATGGTIRYSSNGTDFSTAIPKGINAGTYKVYYKAVGDASHKDSDVAFIEATIKPKTVTPTVELSQEAFDYDGTEKKPAVTLKDGTDVIPASEYTVSYENNKEVGTGVVTVKDKLNGNYEIAETSKTFDILASTTYFPVAAKAATCEEEGNIAYWKGSDGKLYADAEGKKVITQAETVLPKAAHKYTSQPEYKWSDDKSTCTATLKCDDCGEVLTKTVATTKTSSGGIATWTADFQDLDLGKTSVTEKETGFNFSYVAGTPATCYKEGNREYWKGTDGLFYADAEGNVQITMEEIVIPKKEHTPASTPVYEWDPIAKTCTAQIRCTDCGAVTDKETVAATTSDGIDYTAVFTNPAFGTQTKSFENGYASEWNAPTYVWSADNSSCTATRTKKDNPGETESETAGAVVSVNGSVSTYTAKFTNPAFTTQVRTSGGSVSLISPVVYPVYPTYPATYYTPVYRTTVPVYSSSAYTTPVYNTPAYVFTSKSSSSSPYSDSSFTSSTTKTEKATSKSNKTGTATGSVWSKSVSSSPIEGKTITAKADGKGNIIIKWDKVEDAEKYTVCIKQDGKYKRVAVTEKNSYKFKNAKKKGTYEFAVKYTINGEPSRLSQSYKAECTVKKSVSASKKK